MTDPDKSRRIFGAGQLNGLALAGVQNPREFMNAAKLQSALDSLNGIARKVYDNVPEDRAAKPFEIMALMKERTGSKPDLAIVTGCLHDMVHKGLVREAGKDQFQRLLVRTKSEHDALPTLTKPSRPEPTPAPADALDKLAAISAGARATAKSLNALAEQIEDVAIEVEESIQSAGGEVAKLKQLRALLKDIGE